MFTRSCAASLVGLLLAGCSPLTLSVTLGPTPPRITEAIVLQDPNAGGAKIAMVEVRGLIADSPAPELFGGYNPIDELGAALARAENDDAVKAVLLRITSPGGTVTGSDIMYQEVTSFRERSGKPVVVSMGEIAASGGYYLALAGDHVVAYPTTLTGSIGVIFPMINVSEGLSRIGIYSRSITSGPNKDMGNPLEPAEESHLRLFKAMVDEDYDRFRTLVTARRTGIPPEHLDEATDGRVMTGAQAHAWNLVDSLGGVPEAFAEAKRLAAIERAHLVKYRNYPMRARTPYTSTDAPPPSAESEINIFQLNLSAESLLAGTGNRPCYLWAPGLR